MLLSVKVCRARVAAYLRPLQSRLVRGGLVAAVCDIELCGVSLRDWGVYGGIVNLRGQLSRVYTISFRPSN